ncbi:MAG TPA: tetratricopeptide repeat protein [Firmicutes bacterium]|nr:tetratricopeptide repeat protein [Candidatus Fermentithermobacillaceae bacterium]
MREPVRFSLRHPWNAGVLIILLVGWAAYIWKGLDGRLVLLALSLWVLLGWFIWREILLEHVGFLDRWVWHDYDKANLRYRRAVDTGRATGAAYMALASLAWAEGDLSESVRLLEEGLRRMPSDAHAHCLLARILSRLGRHEEALAEAIRCQKLTDDGPLGSMALGEVLAAKGELEAAASAYHKVLKDLPTLAEAHIGLGAVYMAQGEHKEAGFHFQEALKYAPRNPDAHYWMGVWARSQGDVLLAMEEFQKAMMLRNPDDRAHRVAYKDIAEALAWARRAVEGS